jgi:hypothetical protein
MLSSWSVSAPPATVPKARAVVFQLELLVGRCVENVFILGPLRRLLGRRRFLDVIGFDGPAPHGLDHLLESLGYRKLGHGAALLHQRQRQDPRHRWRWSWRGRAAADGRLHMGGERPRALGGFRLQRRDRGLDVPGREGRRGEGCPWCRTTRGTLGMLRPIWRIWCHDRRLFREPIFRLSSAGAQYSAFRPTFLQPTRAAPARLRDERPRQKRLGLCVRRKSAVAPSRGRRGRLCSKCREVGTNTAGHHTKT